LNREWRSRKKANDIEVLPTFQQYPRIIGEFNPTADVELYLI
jgi:hypothetical protein